jgi:hypothetical protein
MCYERRDRGYLRCHKLECKDLGAVIHTSQPLRLAGRGIGLFVESRKSIKEVAYFSRLEIASKELLHTQGASAYQLPPDLETSRPRDLIMHTAA